MPSLAQTIDTSSAAACSSTTTASPPPRRPRAPSLVESGTVIDKGAGFWGQGKGRGEGRSEGRGEADSASTAPPSPPINTPCLLVHADEDAVIATRDLEGRLGLFVRSVERLTLGIGARIKLHLRGHSFSCTVVSFTSHTDDVLASGIYLTPDTDDDGRSAALYFATRHAIFFEP